MRRSARKNLETAEDLLELTEFTVISTVHTMIAFAFAALAMVLVEPKEWSRALNHSEGVSRSSVVSSTTLSVRYEQDSMLSSCGCPNQGHSLIAASIDS